LATSCFSTSMGKTVFLPILLPLVILPDTVLIS
jgi:hypothetical protein